MKAKKYTNSSWTEGDYEKEYSTATDTYTTLPATFQTSGADVENYQVYGAASGAGEETENLFDYMSYFSTPFTSYDQYFDYNNIQLAANTTYTLVTNFHSGHYQGIRGTPFIATNSSTTPTTATGGLGDDSTVTITTNNDGIIRLYIRIARGVTEGDLVDLPTLSDFENGKWIKIVQGSTYPSYKIPILNTSQSGNLFDKNATDETKGYLNNRILRSDGSIKANGEWIVSEYIPVFPETTYEVSGAYNTAGVPSIAFYNSNKEFISAVEYNYEMPKTVVTPPLTAFMRASVVKTRIDTAYIIGYYQSNYDLFLGDSKLYEDEYLDFVEQKVYKYVSGVLTPTDPPAPFPALSTYLGENNLSVDTTVQPEKVAVTVAAWREIEGEKYQNEEWSDNNDT